MAIEIFNRYENKYRLDEKTFTRLEHRLDDFMTRDAHSAKHGGTYPILNLYYDTAGNDVIRASLAKPAYKEKLRLRAYGVPSMDSEVFAEIKKKSWGVVNKRRSCLKLSEAYAFFESGQLPEVKPYMNSQVLREIAYMLECRALEPALCLSYERLAFFGGGREDLRVSFDTNIQTRRTDLRLENGAYGEQLLKNGEWLMEIKAAGAIPLWLTALLAEFKIYPSSFSKYGTEYRQRLMSAQTA